MFAVRRSLRLVSARAFTTLGRSTLPKAFAATLPSLKPFHRNASSIDKLEKALRAEIKYEDSAESRELAEEYLQLKEDVQKTWKLNVLHDKSEVELTRKYKNFNIKVAYDVQSMTDDVAPAFDDEEGGDEEENEPGLGINFEVTVANDKGKVIYDCAGNDVEITIRNVSFVKSGEETSFQNYTGPDFNQLDKDLQDQLFAFLEEVGVDRDLGGFMVSHAEEVENDLYLNWLKHVHGVVAAK